MTVLFFEDPFYDNFEPLSISHPVYSLLCGTSRIYEKWLRFSKTDNYGFLSRPYLSEIVRLETGKKTNVVPDDDLLLINGRIIPSPELMSDIENLGENEALEIDDSIAAIRIKKGASEEIRKNIEEIYTKEGLERLVSSLKIKKTKGECLNYIWDLVNLNEQMITEEAWNFNGWPRKAGFAPQAITLSGPENIFIHESVEIMSTAVIDASEGPVIIEENTKVEPYSYIQGPCYIGPGCRIVGGRIRSGSSFGPVCRVGGEVESSIMLGYCNKYHEGFLGHAYLGEWVNLGALTTNSDLKNNYKAITVELAGKTIDTESIKIGCFIGDHTKTGIGTMLNTGINIGFSCNLYGAALFADKSISSFSWGAPGDLQQYNLFKSMETAEISMGRRNVKFQPAHKSLFKSIFDLYGSKT